MQRENCGEAGADWFLIRAPVPGQGCLFGLRMSEVNPPARARLMQSKLLLRTDLVAVIPIDGWIGRGVVCNFGGVGLILLSLRALFFLHFALLDALHFFLPLLKCRGHKPLLTAECGEGPGPCRPAHPWKRKTTSAVRAAGAPTHGNLRSKNGRVRRPCRVHHWARVLRSARQNSSDRAARRLRPSGALHSPSSYARQLLFHRGRSWPAPLPRRWAFRRMQNRARARSPGPSPCERELPGRTGQTVRAIRSPRSGSSCCPQINSSS